MPIIVFSIMFFAFPTVIIFTCWACSEIKAGGEKVKNKTRYFVVESSKNTYVFHDEESAIKKQSSLLLALREPISIQIMEQMSLEDHLKESKKKVTFHG